MNAALSQTEKTTLQQKRQDLFSIWGASGAPQIEAVPPTQTPEPITSQPVSAPDEVQRLINRFADPNADRMFLG